MNISSKEYAQLLLENTPVENIITEIFKHFKIDCINFCDIDHKSLDELAKQLTTETKNRINILTKIIDLVKNSISPLSYNRSPIASKALKYIENHYDENFSIKELAKELNVSYYYLSHLFKQYYNCSVNEFKNIHRLRKAEYLLSCTNKKISEISIECGYDNPSYLSELFTKHKGMSPSKFRANIKNKKVYFPFYDEYDIYLANKLETYKFLSSDLQKLSDDYVETYTVHDPSEEYAFLHEAAIIEYHGVLYSSWFNCPDFELRGRTPVMSKRSYDGGKTWTVPEIIADDPTGKILYAPPIYGICDDKLYMFINEMVASDKIHAINLYILDTKTDKFLKLWSKPIPFKLNTNVVTLPNGKLMLPGRIAEPDNHPYIPAVLISDSGKIDADWRVVKIAEDEYQPDGELMIHPEISPIINGGKIYMFCRNDRRRVPLLYISEDNGESWKGPYTHDIPLVATKVYTGTLSDGRNYIIGNIDKFNRTHFVIYFSKPGTMEFNKCVTISNTDNNAAHYPSAYESNGKLHIIYSYNHQTYVRSAIVSNIDLNNY